MLHAYCLKAVENLRKAEVMADATAQALGRRVRTIGTLKAATAVPKPLTLCGLVTTSFASD